MTIYKLKGPRWFKGCPPGTKYEYRPGSIMECSCDGCYKEQACYCYDDISTGMGVYLCPFCKLEYLEKVE